MFSKIQALALCLAIILFPAIASAGNVPKAVKNACRGDFMTHCMSHKPGSSGARDCMAGVFHKLSDPCTSAILNSDLVNDQASTAKPKSQVAKQAKPKGNGSKVRSAKRYKPKPRTKNKRVAKHRGKTRWKKIGRAIKHRTRATGRKIARAFRKVFR